jgi:hypothetical protein
LSVLNIINGTVGTEPVIDREAKKRAPDGSGALADF